MSSADDIYGKYILIILAIVIFIAANKLMIHTSLEDADSLTGLFSINESPSIVTPSQIIITSLLVVIIILLITYLRINTIRNNNYPGK